ncbi:hypothetical protein EMA8858_00772 [Emticicia aquatica]|uniref:Outer membrane protein beta-barrel domain-containing protein n=1 Tax=Emticicia aquatica TaxID=1681835 RepID=A0ABM9AM17_9BACT|nr:hypothetical protein [Emticicia aquatica]CAH0994660.1 hypothetical protein EMA8858_00772 [Emticicia aquatica]
MKTDKFDEEFRRKVESFHPPFRDDEIDRIQGYVNQHIPLSIWQRFGHVFTYSVATAIIVSLLITTLYQANENKTLLNKISSLNKQLEQKQVIVTTSNKINMPVTIEKTDTIYVLKHIKKEVEVASISNNFSVEMTDIASTDEANLVSIEEKSSKNILPNSKRVFADKNASPDTKLKTETRSLNLIENERKEKLSLNSLNNTKNKKYNDLKNNNRNVEKTVRTSKASKNDVTTADVFKNGIENSNQTVIVSESQSNKTLELGTSENSKVLIISDLKSKGFGLFDLKYLFDLSNRKINLPQVSSLPKSRSSFKFSSISAPNLKYRVGLGGNVDNSQIGSSILTDILFAKRWSLTTGVNVSFLGFEHFGDEDDFKRKTDKDFREQHTVNVPIGNSIENIEAHQVLFRVPIYLNYRLPFQKNYTGLFATGTDLDFNLKQFTSYSHRNFAIDDEHEGLIEKIPVIPFNNWMISTGIEKRWNQFSLQMSPYFAYQIKQVSYRKNDFTFGLKLNGFYRISR